MKLTKILFTLLTAALLGACSKEIIVENDNPRHIVITAEIPDDNLTRAYLTQKDGSLDMIAQLDEDDKIYLLIEQDGVFYHNSSSAFFGDYSITSLAENKKSCTFEFDLREEIDPNKPYTIYGGIGMRLLIADIDDNKDVGVGYSYIFHTPYLKGIPLYFVLESSKVTDKAKFKHLTAYEILHVSNTSKDSISFNFGGYDVDEPWYYTNNYIQFPDFRTWGDNNTKDGYSDDVTIKPGETKDFMTFYLPTGKKMTDAKLRAIVNGTEITSSNTKSSDVEIKVGNAYHMYATWDGKELKFREDDMPVGENIETITINGVSFNMVRVDGGTFMMGANEKQTSVAYENEFPAHKVTLSTYYIGETEVIQRLWKAVMGEDWYFYYEGDSLPVNNVSYSEIQEFLLKLNKLTGKNFRLPSEAEWEFAAKGGIKSCNYIYSGSDNLTNVTSTLMNISNVARFQPNELGIYDMSGNVDEFCADDLGQYSADDAFNPQGPVLSKMVAVRGDSWSTSSPPNEYWYYRCRTSYRGSTFKLEGGRARYRGFRLVMGKPWVNNIVEEYISSMVYVQGGTFLMGGEPSYDYGYYKYLSPQPAHQVELSSFYISKYEVPQLLWETVMGDNPSIYKGEIKPVENVSWNDCQEFITRLNNMTNKHFRLPTEAEWEYSARGGCLSQGFAYAGSDSPGEVTAAYYNYFSETMEVVGLKPNELDIYNMSGNVSEWCQDICAEYTSDSCINPQGSQKGIYRIHRGGGAYPFSESWFFYVRNRYYDVPETRDATIGLRLVLDL